MYVPYEDYLTIKHGYVAMNPIEQGEGTPKPIEAELSEDAYMQLSIWADAIIDNWLLGRVGRAIECKYELPQQVVALYCAIIDNLPATLESSHESSGELVSSFSNGVDSYSFDLTKTASDTMKSSLGWMVEALPIEWSSRCLYSVMEFDHARRPF